MAWIDASNVEQFVGKTIDATPRRFHYYPLTILHRADIGYCYRDRTGTVVRNDFASCQVLLAKAGGQELGRWPLIRELLNQYCGYNLGEDDVLLLIINGTAYYIADITLRMLTPRELYNAMGFSSDYIIERDYKGNAYGKTKQVARCGNAVCPPLAEAMVRANLPEWCGQRIVTMEQLHAAVAI